MLLQQNAIDLPLRDLNPDVMKLFDDQMLWNASMMVLMLNVADKLGREMATHHVDMVWKLAFEKTTLWRQPFLQSIPDIARLKSESHNRKIRIAFETAAFRDLLLGGNNDRVMDYQLRRLGPLC
jgi:hypothetical protein